MSDVGIRLEKLHWKGFHDVIERGHRASAFACADDVGRRDAKEGDIHGSHRRFDTDRDQSWRRDTGRTRPGELENYSYLLRSLLRDHLGGDDG